MSSQRSSIRRGFCIYQNPYNNNSSSSVSSVSSIETLDNSPKITLSHHNDKLVKTQLHFLDQNGVTLNSNTKNFPTKSAFGGKHPLLTSFTNEQTSRLIKKHSNSINNGSVSLNSFDNILHNSKSNKRDNSLQPLTAAISPRSSANRRHVGHSSIICDEQNDLFLKYFQDAFDIRLKKHKLAPNISKLRPHLRFLGKKYTKHKSIKQNFLKVAYSKSYNEYLKTPLVNGLHTILSNLNTRIHSSRNLKFDKIFQISKLTKLSDTELLVITNTNSSLLLHSDSTIGQSEFNNYTLKEKVATNSISILKITEDLNWYLKWKFI
ncbi:hypothetical protein TBLA_0I01690 [Henningerozyma blattae CBS 6284]|uniref:Uncharacterized protein n=1 Tax=Henningerozyma blattae (strain ATCC 34711 / CBS 6284 / DSM 70876 / NBRC 10599 / NRRL Y-10934 / UCD 77-7) TaxID=1071380 RepID=I2H8X5_HENB6|nr:hypothetical protein TBLA_0I01690 [Tetrapisispora blattae CBS 6284]CCH62827.1 hypothetical protein TBLA_0I01690 [Tetrapisispora blattae CBS 6284]